VLSPGWVHSTSYPPLPLRNGSPENVLSNLALDKIANELQLLNAHLADANDIAMLSTFTPWPADLDNESRKALGQLRDRLMERARSRIGQANDAGDSELASA